MGGIPSNLRDLGGGQRPVFDQRMRHGADARSQSLDKELSLKPEHGELALLPVQF